MRRPPLSLPANRRVPWALGALLLPGCAPTAQRPQPVQVFEGHARVLLVNLPYRLTFTVNPVTHELRGTLEQRRSGDRFDVQGTLLATPDGEELTAHVTAGPSPTLKASFLGFGVSGVSLKADALLTGRLARGVLTGTLRVNAVPYPITLRRVP